MSCSITGRAILTPRTAKPIPTLPPAGPDDRRVDCRRARLQIDERPRPSCRVDRASVWMKCSSPPSLRPLRRARERYPRSRSGPAEGIADGDHEIADLQRVGVANFRLDQFLDSTFNKAISVPASAPTSFAAGARLSFSVIWISRASSRRARCHDIAVLRVDDHPEPAAIWQRRLLRQRRRSGGIRGRAASGSAPRGSSAAPAIVTHRGRHLLEQRRKRRHAVAHGDAGDCACAPAPRRAPAENERAAHSSDSSRSRCARIRVLVFIVNVLSAPRASSFPVSK